MTRKIFIGGNWKSNGTLASNDELIAGLNKEEIDADKVEVVVAPTFLHLMSTMKNIQKNILVAAQNCSLTSYGAFTGEVSAEALVDLGLKWVILGHSERRSLYEESNETVAKKSLAAIKAGLSVIFCVGEKLEERNAEQTFQVLSKQLSALSDKLSAADWEKIVVAYEPVWAIGTGLTASPEQAQEAHVFIRRWIKDKYSATLADSVRIIYGGSVKGSNSVDLIKKPDVDGFLVGGASLKVSEFSTILKSPIASGRV